MSITPAQKCAVLALVGGWGALQNLYRLDAANWAGDELTYRSTGWEYVHGDFSHNFDHPFTGKLVLGLGQLLLGRDQAQVRIVPAVASLLTGVLLYALIRREAGFAAGVTALGAWLVLPHSAPGLPVRIDRFGMLEPILTLFVLATVYAGWRWHRSGATRWAVATGAAAGLAVTTKATGALVVPVVFLVVVATRRGARLVAQLSLAAAVGLLVSISSYAVAGGRGAHAVEYMVAKQTAHHVGGHLVEIAGRPYVHPPWWAHLWFQTESYGRPVTAVIAVLALIGLTARPRALALLLLGAVIAPLAALSGLLGFALPFYYLVWQPALMGLVALGVGVLCRANLAARALVPLALAPMLVLAAATTTELLRLQPSGYDLLAETPLLGAVGSRGDVVLVLGDADRVATFFDPGQPVLTWIPRGARVAAIVVDCAFARRHPRSPVLVHVAQRRTRLAAAHVDDLLVYVPRSATAVTAPASHAHCARSRDGTVRAEPRR
ncbi:MAG TPA: glycosyltransferase family 39 protein [Mycobacteriales bacterium]|nr:glycosyltransferase family 39 protein [Mycobacteriales bacterium]